VVNPGPLRAPVEVQATCDVPPGSPRAQAGVMLGAEVQAPTMTVAGDVGHVVARLGLVEEGEPTVPQGPPGGRTKGTLDRRRSLVSTSRRACSSVILIGSPMRRWMRRTIARISVTRG